MRSEFSENLLTNGNHAGEEKLKDKLWIETKKLWVVAGPAIFTRFSNFGTQIIAQAFIGHIGSTQLAGFALVVTVIVRFANGILLGMASALETLCGQAYGANHYHMLGVYLQRSWIVLLTTSLFLLPLFVFTTPILKALGQDAAIAEVAGKISLWYIPVIFSFIPCFTCQMFLQSQSKNTIIVYLAAVALALQLFLSWLLTVRFNFGVPGVMVSLIVGYWLPNIGQLAFIMCGGCRETWKGFSSLAFKDLWLVVKLSLASGAMLCLELWYNTVLILLTGNMANAEIAIDALSICLNINGWEMMISLGFLAAAGVRVSNELGRGSSKAAKFSIVNVVITSFFIGLVLFALCLLFRGRIAYIFTENTEVVAAVESLSTLLAFSILLNSVQPVLSGVAIGAGWQSIVAYVNLASYYVVGVPVGAVLGYVFDFGVRGVWIGMMFGILVQTVVIVIITSKTDWDKQVSIAQERVNKWCVKPESPDVNQENV